MRNRSVDFHRLFGDALLPLGRKKIQRAHVVEPVGQLDDDDADVLHHGQHHFAEALGLAVFGGEEVQLAQLGDAVDASGDLVAEVLADLLNAGAGVFHDVVKQASLDANQVHLHAGQRMRHQERVIHEGLAGIALLAAVMLAGKPIGLFQRRKIVLGPVLAHLGFELGKQPPLCSLGFGGNWLGGHWNGYFYCRRNRSLTVTALKK